MRVLRIHEAAADEAAAAVEWYEHERRGLGAEFARALDSAFDLLETGLMPLMPMPHVSGTRGVKRLMLKRFPYDLVVRERDSDVVVIAVAHQARRPGYWRGRLRS